jgi:AcrR family transcriptional regulator
MSKREQIFNAALEIAEESGVESVHGAEISQRTGIKQGALNYFYGSMDTLRNDVMKWARENGKFEDFQDPRYIDRRRASAKVRKKQLMAHALDLAIETNYREVTRDQIADAAGISTSLVTHYLGTLKSMRRDIVRAALADEIPEVIAQAIACKDPRVANLPPEEKAKYLSILAA